jgi:3-hydroxyacyl-[acyl-carrier-protein] dehydratase
MGPEPSAVLALLPQREPQLLIGRVVSLDLGRTLVATYRIPADASYFQGHFPDDPVVPGVVQIEALVQASALLALATDATLGDRAGRILLMGLDDVRFRRRVGPGDELELSVTVRSRRGPVWKLDCVASVCGEPATVARLLLNVTTTDAR